MTNRSAPNAALALLLACALAPAAELFVRQARDMAQAMLRGTRATGAAAAL